MNGQGEAEDGFPQAPCLSQCCFLGLVYAAFLLAVPGKGRKAYSPMALPSRPQASLSFRLRAGPSRPWECLL